MSKDWLRNKTVLITGADGALGRYITYHLIVKYNCNVIGVDIKSKNMVTFLNKITECSKNFTYFEFDASSEKAWDNFLSENKPKVDVLINCMGVFAKVAFADKITNAESKKTFSTNYFAYVISTQKMLPILEKSIRPAIVNISCVSSVAHAKGTSAYSASKSALNSFTQILARELDKKFYVSLILCGMIKNEFFIKATENSKSKILKGAMSALVAGQKIVSAISKRKTRARVGVDSKIIDVSSRLFPSLTSKLINKYIDILNKKSTKKDLEK